MCNQYNGYILTAQHSHYGDSLDQFELLNKSTITIYIDFNNFPPPYDFFDSRSLS